MNCLGVYWNSHVDLLGPNPPKDWTVSDFFLVYIHVHVYVVAPSTCVICLDKGRLLHETRVVRSFPLTLVTCFHVTSYGWIA